MLRRLLVLIVGKLSKRREALRLYANLDQKSGWSATLPVQVLACLASAVLCWLIREYDFTFFPSSPYAHQMFSFGVAFMVITRTNIAYNHYWEGISEITKMQAMWWAAITKVMAFDELCPRPLEASGRLFRTQLLHLTSLISAVSVMELQGLTELDPKESIKDPLDVLVAFNSDHLDVLDQKEGADGVDQKWVKSAFERKHGYKKGWFDVERRNHRVLPILGKLTEAEGKDLKKSSQWADCILTRMIRLTSTRHQEGGLTISSAILNRIFEEFSTGRLGYTQSQKVADFPLPFPYAQISEVVQVGFVLTCPFLVTSFVSEVALACLLTFLSVFAFTSLNLVAADLERPFGNDETDLSLHRLHVRFVHQLAELLHTQVEISDLETLSSGETLMADRCE